MKIITRTLITLFAIAILSLSVVLMGAADKRPMVIAAPVMVVTATPTPSAVSNAVTPSITDAPVRVLQTEPVTFTIPVTVWIAWIVTIGTAIAAIAAIWKFAIKAARFVSDISNYSSVLKEIAREFKNDAGSTLKDALDRIEVDVEKVQKSAELAQKTADDLTIFVRDNMPRR